MLRLVPVILLSLVPLLAASLEEQTAVVYNSSILDSKALAETYAKARNIPRTHLIGLILPDKEEINRNEYDQLLRKPLLAEFDRRGFWQRGRDPKGNLVPFRSSVHVLVTLRGVPSRIHDPGESPPNDATPQQKQQAILRTGNAAVDSELTLLGVDGQPTPGPLNNPYFQKELSIENSKLPILLVGRIDAHSYDICKRMIKDATSTEKTGLWGTATVDVANKIPLGDGWLENAAKELENAGIPTLVDPFNDTLPDHFPMPQTSLYLGWYDWNVSGPFLNPAFRFKRGAVACHLHSFSAQQLRNPAKNWSAALLARGAAATVGNVYEPFLHLTHHFDILINRLLAGHTLVESAYMAMPALSWQGIVLGDPLYRPFIHFHGTGEITTQDTPYRAVRLAKTRWGDHPSELHAQLRAAAKRTGDPFYLEAVALDLAAEKEWAAATAALREARAMHTDPADRLRLDLWLVLIDRASGNKAAAIQSLRTLNLTHSALPEAKAIKAWLDKLVPPPPKPRE